MKKNNLLFIIALLLFSITVNGQGKYDALRFSQQYYEGTARTVAMGNAFTALGGDLGALSINPAASGVYRYSEFVFTPSFTNTLDNTIYLGNGDSQKRTKMGLSNIGFVYSKDTGRRSGLKYINFALTANQTNNYTSRTSAYGQDALSSFAGSLAANMPTNISGFDLDMPDSYPSAPFYDTNVSWTSILGWNSLLLDTLGSHYDFIGATENIYNDSDGDFIEVGGPLSQKYFRETTGYTSDIIFNLSGNISDKLFLGVNFTMQSIWYSETKNYSEEAVDPYDFQTYFSDFTHNTSLITSGTGIGLKAGFIYLPFAGLRVGGSISTPTLMYLTDNWSEDMSTNIDGTHRSVESPIGEYDYRVTSPFKWNVGAAYTFGTFALLSVDYESTDYSNITMAGNRGNKTIFSEENQQISKSFRKVNNIRSGLEVRVTPKFSLRGGYSYYDSDEVGFDSSRHYASGGVGYRADSGFTFDVAYQQQCNSTREFYTLYSDYAGIQAPLLENTYSHWKLLFSFGWKF